MHKLTMQTITAAQARRIALAAQGFGVKRIGPAPTWRRVRSTIDRLGLFQMDSINIVTRAHYMPAFSRIGAYDRQKFDDRAFHPRRRELFEYWAHEASLMPLALQPLLRWRMARASRFVGIWESIAGIGRDRPEYVEQVRRQIADHGPMSAREFDIGGRRGGSMWDWHEAKTALEFLFATGTLTVHSRRGFERVYDLVERVIPTAILDRPTPAESDAQRALVAIAARALGIATQADLRDYFRLSAVDGARAVEALVESGDIEPVAVEGWRQAGYLARDASKPHRVRGSALVSPFDPLVWERKRTERLFGFRYRIEIYTPSHKRTHGYYVFPYLLDEALVARVDLKADRAGNALRVLATHGEDGIDREQVADALAAELRRLADWLGLADITVACRGDLASDLRRNCAH